MVLFSHEHDYIGRFSNLHECTFNIGNTVLQKVKDRYHNCGGKGKAAEYHIANKEVLEEKEKCRYINFSEEKKETKREYGKK